MLDGLIDFGSHSFPSHFPGLLNNCVGDGIDVVAFDIEFGAKTSKFKLSCPAGSSGFLTQTRSSIIVRTGAICDVKFTAQHHLDSINAQRFQLLYSYLRYYESPLSTLYLL